MALKIMAFLLVAAFVGLFFIDGPNGKRIMTVDDFIPSVPASLDDLAPADIVPSGPTKVYKWKDENGIWQFSNKEEDSQGLVGNAVETMELDGDINIMPAVDIPPRQTSRLDEETTKKSKLSSLPSGLTSVSPEKIGEMMDTVNNLQDTVDQRKSELDKINGSKD
jgi:hypothetical protein